MLKVAFVLAALLATEGAVFSLPVINARGYESSDIVPRAEPGIIQRRASDPPIGIGFVPTEDLYNQIVDSLVPSKQPTQPTVTVTVAARDLSDQEDIEARGYWDEDENHLARRGLDDGLMERDYVELVRRKHKKKTPPQADLAAQQAAEAQKQREAEQRAAEEASRRAAEQRAAEEAEKQRTAQENTATTGPPEPSMVNKFLDSDHVQGLVENHPHIQYVLNHGYFRKGVNALATFVKGKIQGDNQIQY